MATSSSLPGSSRSSGNKLGEAGRTGSGAGHSHMKSRHDIFLSHSGVQKGLVKGLYKRLCPLYSTFFDIQYHSLPPGHSFPPLIFHAANTCRLAVLVLSHNFLTSRWPMLELHALVNAKPQPLILPLFFGLSPDDLKNDGNLQSWRMAWATFAAHDPSRINVTTWEDALRVVRMKNGLTFDEWEGQPAFIQRVVSCIFEILPPSLRHDFSGIQGKDRLCEILVGQFEELQRKLSPAQTGICVVGMYGPPGSGKSTLLRCLTDYYFPHFAGKALHLELPTNNPTDAQLLLKSKELFKLTDFMDRVDLHGASNILQVRQEEKERSLERMKLAMVLLEMGAKCFSDGEYFNLCRWSDVLQAVWRETYDRLGGSLPASALEEVLRGEGRIPKHQLLQKCHSDLAFQLLVLEAFAQMDSRLFKYVYRSILQF